MVETSNGVAGGDGGGEDNGSGHQQVGIAASARRAGKEGNGESGGKCEGACERKTRAADFTKGYVRGLHEDERVRGNVSDLHDGKSEGCAANPTKAGLLKSFGFPAGAARNEEQKNDPADREGLKAQRRAAE
jgi:hypothetical protein